MFVDSHQLENAILNLAVNGRDAMDGEGQLIISTANEVMAANAVGDIQPGEYLRISVSDIGSGMSQEVIDRAFEPFFTTKPVGKGTGLGLSQIFGFAHQSGGEVGIESTPGKGTTVSIYLPRTAAEATNLRLHPAAQRQEADVTVPEPAFLLSRTIRASARRRSGRSKIWATTRSAATGGGPRRCGCSPAKISTSSFPM